MKDLKLINTYSSRMEAEVSKSYLDSNGIKSYIVSDDIGEMYPSQQITSGVRLFVDKEYYETAKRLIEMKES